MSEFALPDLLSTTILQRRGAALSLALQQAGEEMTTGLRNDLYEASAADMRRLLILEQDLKRAAIYKQSMEMAEGRAGAMSASIEQIRLQSDDLAYPLLAAVGVGDLLSAGKYADKARDVFKLAVSGLNSSYAGRSLFSGADSDQAALREADLIIADLELIAATAPTSAALETALDTYFNDPAGGFSVNDYLGSSADVASVQLAEREELDYAIKADDVRLRELLHGLALTFLAKQATAPTGNTERLGLYASGAEKIATARNELIAIEAAFGDAIARIDFSGSRAQNTLDRLQFDRNIMIERTPLDAASNFQQAETRLQALYTVLGRTAGMSLVNYLR